VHHDPSRTTAGELVHAPETGDAASDVLAALYATHCAPLRWYAQSLTRSEDEAAEVVQEVFAHMVVEGDLLIRQEKPVAFLFRSVRNHALNRMRGERIQDRTVARYAVDLCAQPRTAHNDGDRSVLNEEVDTWLAKLVEELPAKQREVFRLVRFSGVPYGEVARILKVQFSTVATHMMRASNTLASRLAELGLIDVSLRRSVRLTADDKMNGRVHNSRSRRVI
jgi:RNA polymerase sigma-70 factor (ECF subfamily)